VAIEFLFRAFSAQWFFVARDLGRAPQAISFRAVGACPTVYDLRFTIHGLLEPVKHSEPANSERIPEDPAPAPHRNHRLK